MSRTVVAVFDRYVNAERAAKQIKENGLRTDDISIVAKHSDSADEYETGVTAEMKSDRTIKNDNISDGVLTGGVLGGLAGLLIGAGTMVVPGLGIIAAAGPITGFLSGAVTGGVVGGLVDLGIPESESRRYETDLKSGKILFSMKTPETNIDSIVTILRNNGAINVKNY